MLDWAEGALDSERLPHADWRRELMMARRLCLALTLLAALLAASCSLFTADACETIELFGLQLTVVDAATGAGIASGGIIRAIDGTYEDSVIVQVSPIAVPPQHYALLPERAGTYELSVTLAGYAPWIAPTVRILNDGCHVQPVNVTARLTRAP